MITRNAQISLKWPDIDMVVKRHLLMAGKYIPDDVPYKATIADVKWWMRDMGIPDGYLTGLRIIEDV